MLNRDQENDNSLEQQDTTTRLHVRLAEKNVQDKHKRPSKHSKNENNSTATPASTASQTNLETPTSIDDYINTMISLETKHHYKPFFIELTAELQEKFGVTIANDINSYKYTNIIPVVDSYDNRMEMINGLGYTSSRIFLNTKDNKFYKASMSGIYNLLQHPDVEPALTPLAPGGYVFAAIALKSSTGTIFLDIRFNKFKFQRNTYVEASGHRGLVDSKSLNTHAYYSVLPIKKTKSDTNIDDNDDHPESPYLSTMSKTAPALLIAGEIYVQPEEGTDNELKDKSAMDLFRVGTPQTGNYNEIQTYHGAKQEALIRYLFGSGKHFVFFPFPSQELATFTKNSPEYKQRLRELTLQVLDKAQFTYEDKPIVTSASSATGTKRKISSVEENTDDTNAQVVKSTKTGSSPFVFNVSPTPVQQETLDVAHSVSNKK